MSIYNRNRAGSMAYANEAVDAKYNDRNIGLIMVESEMNDMSFFEACLRADFREIKGLQEGTLLESEIEALNEATFKEFINNMQVRLSRFWRKIKDAIEIAIEKVSAFILRDGKKFVAEYERIETKYAEKTAKRDSEGKLKFNLTINVPKEEFSGIKILNVVEVEKGIRKGLENGNENIEKKKVISDELKASVSGLNVKLEGDEVSPSDYRSAISDAAFEEVAIKSYAEAKKYADIGKDHILSGSKEINNLRDAKKQVNNQISRLGKMLKEVERDATNPDGEKIKRINILVSAFETVVSCVTAVKIKLIKSNVKAYRSMLTKFMHAMSKKGNDEITVESALLLAEAEVDYALEAAIGEDEQAEIEEIIANADSSDDIEL